MEEMMNGISKDEVYQKVDVEGEGEGEGAVVVQDGIKDQIDDEALRMNSVSADDSIEVAVSENGVEIGKGLSLTSPSSSSDDETEIVPTKITSTVKYEEENGIPVLIVEEEAVETEAVIESSQVTEELEVAEVFEEQLIITLDDVEETAVDVSPPADGESNESEEEREVIIKEESQRPEAVAMELADVVEENGAKESDQVEFVEENSSVTLVKSSNGTDNSDKVELPETNGNPHIISISARTVRATSWRGCCGLLEVFRRGD